MGIIPGSEQEHLSAVHNVFHQVRRGSARNPSDGGRSGYLLRKTDQSCSIQAFEPSEELAPYAATKAALVSLTKSLAKICIKGGIRVNGVAPGPVWTPLIPATMTLDKVQNFGEATRFKCPAQPSELAALYVFLATDEASYVTGEIFGATGGKTPF